jgi:hypothetical protein
MTKHPTHPHRPSRKEVEAALSSLDFPLDKENLVECIAAQGRHPDDGVLHQIRALPLGRYASAAQVVRSIEVADQHGP